MVETYTVYQNLEDYGRAFSALSWDRYIGFGDYAYDYLYSGDIVVTLAEFRCPNEVYLSKTRDVLDAFLPTIVGGQNITPLRVRLWAKDEGQQLFGHPWGSTELDFKARIEVVVHGSLPAPAIALAYALAILVAAIGLSVLGLVWRPLIQGIGKGVQNVGEAIKDIGEGIGEVGKGIAENLLPFACILGGAILGGIYLSKRYSRVGVKT